jgi:tetrahydromethanopterin S-methyltransferase subunit G
MPVELTVDDLIRAVAQLSPDELSDFELRLEEMRIARSHFVDAEIAQIADAYRLPAQARSRVRELLQRNRTTGLAPAEEQELDSYLAEMDERLEAAAEEMLALAGQRQRNGGSRRVE